MTTEGRAWDLVYSRAANTRVVHTIRVTIISNIHSEISVKKSAVPSPQPIGGEEDDGAAQPNQQPGRAEQPDGS